MRNTVKRLSSAVNKEDDLLDTSGKMLREFQEEFLESDTWPKMGKQTD